jgi:hypothetical protein
MEPIEDEDVVDAVEEVDVGDVNDAGESGGGDMSVSPLGPESIVSMLKLFFFLEFFMLPMPSLVRRSNGVETDLR